MSGSVTTPDGKPVEGVVVVHVESGTSRATDGRGRFSFPKIDRPATLRLVDPRFEVLEVVLGGGAFATAPIVLIPKRPVYVEALVVTARRNGGEVLTPRAFAASEVAPEDLPAPPATVVEMATTAPGVAESGQGGHFQAYSIRGLGGQRVFTAVADVRIVTERRAGATASFVLPSLLESVEVVRGPASTFYGSGALGGVVEALPRTMVGSEIEIGWASQGNDRYVSFGWGQGGWTLAVAGRRSGDSQTPEDDTLPSHYTQWSGVLRKCWQGNSGTSFEVLAIPAVGRDIGKPNSRYPFRTTQYPEEDHLLIKFSARGKNGWRVVGFVHPNELVTENARATTRSEVDNEAFDFGANSRGELAFGDGWTASVGADLFGRLGVAATERTADFDAGSVATSRTLDGREYQGTLYGIVRHALRRATVEFGASLTGISQANRGTDTTSDVAGAGFVGVTIPLSRGFELVANVGSGIRFPSLTERFFTGSTGAGSVIANAGLAPERSLSTDLGARFFGRRLFVEVFAFRNAIDDYIEQAEIAPGVTGFANITAGRIVGIEGSGSYTLGNETAITFSGMHTQGTAESGTELAEIPSDRVAVGGHVSGRRWEATARLEHRFVNDDPGPGEQATPAADLLSASVSYRFARGFVLRLFGNNLLDEVYPPSADELAVPAPGRSVGLSFRWAAE